MSNEPDYIFWAKRWMAARSMCRASRRLSTGVPDLAMINYMTYLAEVFSWLMERRKVKP